MFGLVGDPYSLEPGAPGTESAQRHISFPFFLRGWVVVSSCPSAIPWFKWGSFRGCLVTVVLGQAL